jgi:hypothetical protein
MIVCSLHIPLGKSGFLYSDQEMRPRNEDGWIESNQALAIAHELDRYTEDRLYLFQQLLRVLQILLRDFRGLWGTEIGYELSMIG